MAVTTKAHGKYKGIIVGKTDTRKLKEGLKAKKQDLVAFIILRLQQIGEECVKVARENGRYNDITGNLRSSIGYVVLNDGKPVHSGTLKRYSGTKGNGEDGNAAAESFLQKLQAEYPQGISLVVCAGMDYAAYVEYHEDKDVLHSAEQTAERMLDELLKGVISEK